MQMKWNQQIKRKGEKEGLKVTVNIAAICEPLN